MQAILPRPDIAPLLDAHFVLLAGDADLPQPEVHKLLFALKNATMLPILVIAEPDGTFVTGASGPQDPAQLQALLTGASGA